MRKLRSIAIVLIALSGAGCIPAANESANASSDMSADPAVQEMRQPAGETAKSESSTEEGGGGGGGKDLGVADKVTADTSSPVNRKIIRNAELNLESPDPAEAQRKITSITESKQGFVVSSTKSSAGELMRETATVQMTLRVPSAAFDDALTEIRKAASRVLVEKVTGQDVTEEFIDLEARLKTTRALEEQFLEIMKRANTIEEALRVQRDISQVRGEIEQIQGRIRFLENQSALSTITLRIDTPATVTGTSGGFFYELRGIFSDSIENALGFVLGFVRIILAILPFLLLVVLPLGLVLRYVLTRYHRIGGWEIPRTVRKAEGESDEG